VARNEQLLEWAMKLDVEQLYKWSADKQLPIPPMDRKFLYEIAKKINKKDHVWPKQLSRLERIYTKLTASAPPSEYANEDDFLEAEDRHLFDAEIKHLSVRMAWHDSAWNGKICRSPQDNVYCVGENSLLSDRIRRRRNLEIESAEGCAGCTPSLDKLNGYVPPCFWSINAFGSQNLVFEHDNPVATDFPHIQQNMPPYSVISWPFKLSFTRNAEEQKKYGSYYPKEIFEKRIKGFQSEVREDTSIVFLYCKYSNPVSGEDMKYLVAGCAMLSEKGPMEWFDVDGDQLAKTKLKLKQPNFPSLNWALRYTMDFEGTGVRLPYQEYLELASREGGVSEEAVLEIAVMVDEPELYDCFTYVAKHVDDDQAIYLLMKMRRSLLRVRQHGFLEKYDHETALGTVDMLLEHVWRKRGYLPGIRRLLLSIPEVEEAYASQVADLLNALDLADPDAVCHLVEAIQSGSSDYAKGLEGLLDEIRLFLDEHEITPEDFLTLASLSLTKHQFVRLGAGKCNGRPLSEVCRNPYLLFEEYVPGEETEDKYSGKKIDDEIDIFKVDLALFPHTKYLKRIGSLHVAKVSDPRRLRAVIIDVLRRREGSGDCFLDADLVQNEIEAYPLFYRAEQEYKVKEDLKSPSQPFEHHLTEKIVFRDIENVRVYYLKELYDDEQYIAKVVVSILEKKPFSIDVEDLKSDVDSACDILSRRIGSSFDSEQFFSERHELYERIINQRLYVLTGSPGSGKSYELLKVIQKLNSFGELTRVLTLTGKAALRLRNNDEGFRGVNASTIDKFLSDSERDAAQGSSFVTHNLVIDESSMVDLPKLARLLRTVTTDNSAFKRLILVGDENQLPPIGFGKPFSDIIDFLARNRDKYPENMISLDTNCRAELPNEYIDFAKAFSNKSKSAEVVLGSVKTDGEYFGGGLSLRSWSNREDLYTALDKETQELIEFLPPEVSDMPSLLGISQEALMRPEHLDRFQILTPNRTSYFGASGLNLHYQDNAPGEYLSAKIGEIIFKKHDKVMHTKNEYRNNELFVSNGSMGAVVGPKRLYFEEHEEAINGGELRYADQLELAYAITVHKSQGSGFNYVFIILPERSRFVSRELFYTALTRTKNKVTLFLQRTNPESTVSGYFETVRKNSAILGRRTSLLMDEEIGYAYLPEDGVQVKSRVEYIVYRQLLEAKERIGGFSFAYEQEYTVEGKSFVLHPDFVLHFDDGRVVYWEHLGMLKKRSYVRDWDSRLQIYKKQGDYDSLVTTHELKGISSEKIGKIIDGLISESLVSEDSSNRYSSRHFSLR
jgi:exodeoxyribonuclease V alpha subunit